MFRLHRNAQLAIIPDRDHITLVEKSDTLNPIVRAFLDATPMPAAAAAEKR